MFTQEEIDAVLMDATEAVSSLSEDVDRLDKGAGAKSGSKEQLSAGTSAASTKRSSPARKLSVSPDSRVRRILKLRVPVIVRLAERVMLVSDVLRIRPGTILEFERPVDSELDLLVGNREVGGGVAVKVGEHFGLRITHIGDVRERIESMAG